MQEFQGNYGKQEVDWVKWQLKEMRAKELLHHKFGTKVSEIVILSFQGEPSSVMDTLIEKNQDALLKQGFSGCEVKRNEELKTTYLICFK